MALSIQLCLLLVLTFCVCLLLPKLSTYYLIVVYLLLIPSSAQGLISGTSYDTSGVINLSMVGYATIIYFFVSLLKHTIVLRKESIYLLSLFAIILFIRIFADGTDFISNKLLDNYFLPMLLAIIIISQLNAKEVTSLLKLMYYLILIGAIVACFETFIYGKSLFFDSYYKDNTTWYSGYNIYIEWIHFRSTSFFGHALTGAMYYLLGVCYLFNSKKLKRHKVLFILQFILLCGAIISTNSRAALVGLALILILHLIDKKNIGKMLIAIIIVGILAITVDWEYVYNMLFSRDSSGSSVAVRVQALASIFKLPLKTFLFGEGYNNTGAVLEMLGFAGNVEISYLIILMENGILGFAAWLVSLFTIYRKNMITEVGGIRTKKLVNEMLLIIFVVGAFSNSFGDPGTLNYTIFILLAFSNVLSRAHKHEELYNRKLN